jgi:hypothetical protein
MLLALSNSAEMKGRKERQKLFCSSFIPTDLNSEISVFMSAYYSLLHFSIEIV